MASSSAGVVNWDGAGTGGVKTTCEYACAPVSKNYVQAIIARRQLPIEVMGQR